MDEDGCSQCQDVRLKPVLGRGRTGLALSLELPERVPWGAKSVSEATVGADLAKSAAWALPSPKPSAVGGGDPRGSERPRGCRGGPRPERGAQAGALFGRSPGFGTALGRGG